jgi:hypothetical protein
VGSASLEGSHLPRAGSASLEGSRLPRAGSASFEASPPPRSRLLHVHVCSRTRVRTFNALTTAGRRHHAPGTHAPALSHQLPRGTHPRYCGGLCDTAGVSPMTLRSYSCTANAPCPRRGAGCTLETLSREPAGPNHDGRPAGRHPHHCWSRAAAPVLAAPRPALLRPLWRCRARGEGTPPRSPLYPVQIDVNDYLEPA